MLIEGSNSNDIHEENAMQQFTARFGSLIQGAISGFDRLLLRGSLRQLNHAHGMEVFLFMKGILFKDYDNYVKGVSQRVKQASIAPFLEQKLPVEYLRGGDTDKDQRARQIAAERGITSGDVCVLSATELAPTFEHRGTHMVIRKRPSLALYHYFIHPEFGWMSTTGADALDALSWIRSTFPLRPRSTYTDVVSFRHSRLYERAGVAGPADG